MAFTQAWRQTNPPSHGLQKTMLQYCHCPQCHYSHRPRASVTNSNYYKTSP